MPLIVLTGKEYDSGPLRDWAAKGAKLLGVVAVLAESFERIHRSNLIGVGVLPPQFKPGQSCASLGLTGEELYSIIGLEGIEPLPHEGRSRAERNGDGTEFTVASNGLGRIGRYTPDTRKEGSGHGVLGSPGRGGRVRVASAGRTGAGSR